MKKLIKLFGLFALAAVIGFSMVACRSDGDGDRDGVGEPVIGKKEFKIFYLYAQINTDSYQTIEQWTNNFSLSDLTDYTPQKGDKLKFKINGEMDKQLEWVHVDLSSMTPSFLWLGGKDIGILPTIFNYTFEIEIMNDALGSDTVIFGINNLLYLKQEGKELVNNGRVNPSEVSGVMVTIKNFTVSLIEITRK